MQRLAAFAAPFDTLLRYRSEATQDANGSVLQKGTMHIDQQTFPKASRWIGYLKTRLRGAKAHLIACF
jgi:hypothetical protein